jgi:hypothetical protein
MKNIHILPTDKPSKKGDVVVWNGLKIWNGIGEPKTDYTSKHIEHCHNIAMESLVKESKQESGKKNKI